MATSRRSCVNNPDVFFNVCGKYTMIGCRKHIFEFVRRACVGYFGVKITDQDRPWAPHTVCKICIWHLP